MKNIVFDSDGLIKLTKAGILEKVIEHFICSITKEVYDETVVKGMERFYDDAYQIDGLIKKGKIMVKNIENSKKATNILKGSSLGRGETSSLHLYFSLNAEAIISDDRAFLCVLQQNNVAFITPADFIVRSFELRILSKDESLNALDMIEPYICNYEKAKSDLEV